MMTRSPWTRGAALALLATSLVAGLVLVDGSSEAPSKLGAAAVVQGAQDAPTRTPPRSPGPNGDNIKPRDNWWWFQRAYPGDSIPVDARVRALRQTERIAEYVPPFEPGLEEASATSQWSLVGPSGFDSNIEPTWGRMSGRVRALAIDPNNVNRMFLGTATGGVWRTTDGGASWSPLTDQQDSLAIGAVAIAPTDSNTIYVGTGEGNGSYYGVGVLKSTDGGTNWVKLGESTFRRGQIAGIRLFPADPNAMVVCVKRGSLFPANEPTGVNVQGIYRSTDGGMTFGAVGPGGPCFELAADPTNANVLYASASTETTAGIYKSTDGGANWALLGNAPNGERVLWLSIGIAANGQTIYIGGFSDFVAKTITVHKSTDAGATWTVLALPPAPGAGGYCKSQCDYDNYVRVSPADPNLVFLGGIGMFRSTDGGATFAQIGADNSSDPRGLLHVDHHVLVFQPGNPNVVFEGNDGGIYKSVDAGVTWTSLNGTLAALQPYHVSLHPTDANVMFAGHQDNGTQRRTTSDTWTEVLGGDGAISVVDHANPQVVYASTTSGGFEKSTNGGASFVQAVNGIAMGEPKNWLTPLVMDPTQSSWLYTGTNRLYKTTDGAANWTAISGNLTAGHSTATITSIAISPANPVYIWAATTNGKVQVSVDGGVNFTDVTRAPLPVRWVTAVAAHPTDRNTAYVAFSGFNVNTPSAPGHLFKTTDLGTTWVDVSGTLPDIPFNAVLVRPTAGNEVYVGTDTGVFISTDGGGSWARMSTGMPLAAVSSLAANSTTDLLVAATYGRSIWKTSLASGTTCADGVWHDFFAVDTRETPYVGDFSGDGKTDIITFTRSNPNAFGDVYVSPAENCRFAASSMKWHDFFAISADETVVIGDYNGDGKADIATWLGTSTKQVYVALSTGTGMTAETAWLSSIGAMSTDPLFAGDVDGDGKADLVSFARSEGKVWVALSTGTSFSPPGIRHNFFAVSTFERPRIGDLDGDGKVDIQTFATNSPTAFGDVFVARSGALLFGDGNNADKWHDFFSIDPQQLIRVGDLDGDRKADFFTFMPRPSNQVYMAKSSGTSLGDNELVQITGLTASLANIPYLGDVDADGKADIIVFAQDEGKVRVYPNINARPRTSFRVPYELPEEIYEVEPEETYEYEPEETYEYEPEETYEYELPEDTYELPEETYEYELPEEMYESPAEMYESPADPIVTSQRPRTSAVR